MENVLLVRYGEIHLKGLNRPYFERMLLERIRESLHDMQGAKVEKAQEDITALIESVASIAQKQNIIGALGCGKNHLNPNGTFNSPTVSVGVRKHQKIHLLATVSSFFSCFTPCAGTRSRTASFTMRRRRVSHSSISPSTQMRLV